VNEFNKLGINNFLPLQPEFEMNTTYYIEYKDTNFSCQSNVLFYQFQMNNTPINSISVIPDGCIDILFQCDGTKPFVNVCGSVLQRKEINFQPNTEYFGVRFLPQAQQFNFSVKELLNQEIPLADMLLIEPQLLEKIISEKTFNHRTTLFKDLVGNILLSDSTFPEIIKNALTSIYSSRGNVSMNELADQTGYSTRYLRKQFEEWVGISPKLFTQIVRFQYSLHMLIKIDNQNVFDVS
jgi:AraC-like DNA-binding protein